MISDSPPFWWTRPDWRARLLWPLSLVYGGIAGHIMRHRKRASLPAAVLCIGNFTAGGAGKTPTALTLGAAARAMGLSVGYLSRGYGGSLDRTTLVDPAHHRAMDVGDEPLLLAEVAPTVISRRRVEGAKRLIAEGVDLIIMDDGFQSARLASDFSLIVIDGRRALGNGMMIPAGPVRAPVTQQFDEASALLVAGDGDGADWLVRRAARRGKPVYFGQVRPRETGEWQGKRVLAFAGIADPEKFYRSLRQDGAEIVATRNFADHHQLEDDEIHDLLKSAEAQHLTLVTTSKDHVRLRHQHGPAAKLAACCGVFPVDMKFDDPAAPALIIERAMAEARARMIRDQLTRPS